MSSAVWDTKKITVNGLAGNVGQPQIISLDIPYGSQFGTARIELPESPAVDTSDLLARLVTVYYDGQVIIRGYVIQAPVALGSETIQVVVADIRWLLAQRSIGQYGIGPEDEDAGGFPEVGYRIYFNPGGRANRSEEKEEDTYTFSTVPGSQKWTRRQILEWIIKWYASELTVEEGALDSTWDAQENDLLLYGLSVPAALSRLAARAGQSWGIAYNGTNTLFVPISNAGGQTVTLNLPPTSAGYGVGNASVHSVEDATVTPAIADSVDYIEIQTGLIAKETTLTDIAVGEHSPTLEGFEPSEPGYVYGWRMDVTKYEDAGLGRSFAAGARPKPWLPVLVTRKKPDSTDYYTAADADLKIGLGTPLRPEDCVWMADGDDDSWHLIKAGITILPAEATILMGPHVIAHDGWELWSYLGDPHDDTHIRITVATVLEYPRIARNTPPGQYHIAEDQPIIAMIRRPDLHPHARYRTVVPDLSQAATDPNATLSLAAQAEWYPDIQAEIAEAGLRYLAARKDRETTVTVRTLGIPSDIRLGSRIVISPAQLYQDKNQVVYRISYDLMSGDFLTISATNNIARLIAGDL